MKVLLITVSLLFAASFTWTWPAAVDLNADNGDDNPAADNRHIYTIDSTSYDRCDTQVAEYVTSGVGVANPPVECHRWGLVWNTEATAIKQSLWTPSIVTDDEFTVSDATNYRLPTIKELARMFDYGGDGFEANPVIYDKLSANDNVSNWLISSTYRDVDGRYDFYDHATDGSALATGEVANFQVLAINIKTGEIKAFEPLDLTMCTSFSDAIGTCNTNTAMTRTFYQLLVKII